MIRPRWDWPCTCLRCRVRCRARARTDDGPVPGAGLRLAEAATRSHRRWRGKIGKDVTEKVVGHDHVVALRGLDHMTVPLPASTWL